MNISKKTMKGFSLIEIIIVLAIIAIMTGVLFANNNNNKASQEVQLAAREVAAQLRLLQNDAINGKVIGGKNICKAEMYINALANTYQIRYYDQCSPDHQIPAAGPLKLNKSKLSSAGGSISFAVPRAGITTTLGNGFILESEKDPNQKMIICVKDGNIKEIKGNNIAACAS